MHFLSSVACDISCTPMHWSRTIYQFGTKIEVWVDTFLSANLSKWNSRKAQFKFVFWWKKYWDVNETHIFNRPRKNIQQNLRSEKENGYNYGIHSHQERRRVFWNRMRRERDCLRDVACVCTVFVRTSPLFFPSSDGSPRGWPLSSSLPSGPLLSKRNKRKGLDP